MKVKNYIYKFVTKLENEEAYQVLADDLLEFAQKETSLDINAFPLSLMINPKDFVGFSDHSKYFAHVYETALRLIGARIKQLAYEGTVDRQFAFEMLPLYDPEYRRYLNEKKQKNDVVTHGEQRVMIIMDKIWAHGVPDSVWVKAQKDFLHVTNYTAEEILDFLNYICCEYTTNEDMEILANLSKKIEVRKREALKSKKELEMNRQADNKGFAKR